MPIRHIISDWNGTLFRDPDEGKLWEYAGVRSLGDSTLSTGIPYVNIPTLRTASLALTFVKLKRLGAAYKRGEIGYDEIYRVFNERVLSGIPPHIVEAYAAAYAWRPDTQVKVDGRILRPLQEVRKDGTDAAILSTGYDYGIRRILAASMWGDPFTEIVANPLVRNGEGSRFDLSIYTGEDKKRVLATQLLPPEVSGRRKVLFVGDSETDEACMGYVKDFGGRVAAPFFADDAFKQKIAREYDAFVPESEEDFRIFLRTA